MRRIVPILLVAGLGVVGAGAWFQLQRDSKPQALVLQGNVDIRQANLAFKVPGRIKAMLVEEGDRVTMGQSLARLETLDFEEQLRQAQAQLDASSAGLLELQNGTRPEEIAQARAQVAEGEAAVANARLVFDRQSALLRTGNTPQQSYDNARLNLQQANARLASARAALALAVAGPRAERISAARAERDAARAALALAQQRLADTSVTAPGAGVILSRVQEPGTIVAAGTPVYTLSLERPVWVRAYVGEPDLGRVHPGLRVTVSNDSGGRYQGHVGYISPLAEFTPKTVQTPELRTDLVYRLRVVVDTPDKSLRQGMPVDVTIPLPTAAPPRP